MKHTNRLANIEDDVLRPAFGISPYWAGQVFDGTTFKRIDRFDGFFYQTLIFSFSDSLIIPPISAIKKGITHTQVISKKLGINKMYLNRDCLYSYLKNYNG